MKVLATRLLAFLLSLTLCLLPACAGHGDGDAANTTVPDGVDTQQPSENSYDDIYRERDDSLPALDFDGEEIHFLSMQEGLYEGEISVEEQNSEPLNDAVYYRNIGVEDRLNCRITNESYKGYETAREKLTIAINAGEDTYQVFAHEAAPTLTFGLEGYFYNIYDLPEGYIDLTAPWWSQAYVEEIGADYKLYALAGSLSLSMMRSIYSTFFNKKLVTDNNIEDLYAVVDQGRWTIDYQAELAKTLYIDLNGNSDNDNEDQYGFATSRYWGSDAYWGAFRMDILSRNSDGEFFFNVDRDKLYTAISKINSLYWENPGTFYKDADEKVLRTMFASDSILFLTDKLYAAETGTLRDMPSDYGILPMPKFDEAQEDYGAIPFEIFQLYAIPVTASNPDMVSAVLEALCAESWRKVVPIYSDLVLKGRYMSDPQSREMFDRILGSMYFEAGVLYCYQIKEFAAAVTRYLLDDRAAGELSSKMAYYDRFMPTMLRDLNEKLAD